MWNMRVYKLDPVQLGLGCDSDYFRLQIRTAWHWSKLLIFEKGVQAEMNGFRALSLHAGLIENEMLVEGYEWCPWSTLSDCLSTSADFFGLFYSGRSCLSTEIHDIPNNLSRENKILIECRSDHTNSFGPSVSFGAEKLVETLVNRKHYVCQFENLNFSYQTWFSSEKKSSSVTDQAAKIAWGLYCHWYYYVRTNDCWFWEDFYELMTNVWFVETMKNLRRVNERFDTIEAQAETFALQSKTSDLATITFFLFQGVLNRLEQTYFRRGDYFWFFQTLTVQVPLRIASLFRIRPLKVVYKHTDCLFYRMKNNLLEVMSNFKHILDFSYNSP